MNNTTWRTGKWEPSDEECRAMAEALLDFWYSSYAHVALDFVDPQLITLFVQKDVWDRVTSTMPVAYAGPTVDSNE